MRMLRLMTIVVAAAVGALLAMQAPMPIAHPIASQASACGCLTAGGAHGHPAGKNI